MRNHRRVDYSRRLDNEHGLLERALGELLDGDRGGDEVLGDVKVELGSGPGIDDEALVIVVGLKSFSFDEVDVYNLLGVSTVVVLDHTAGSLDGVSASLGVKVGLLDAEAGVGEAASHPELTEAAAEDAGLIAVHGGNVASLADFLADVTELRGGLDATAVGDAVHATEHLGARHGFVVGAAAIDALEDAVGVHVDDGHGALVLFDDGGFPAAALEHADDVFGGQGGSLLGRGRKARAHFKEGFGRKCAVSVRTRRTETERPA